MPVDRDRNRLVVRRLSRVARHLTTSPSAEDVHKFRTNVRRVEAMVLWLGKKAERDHKKLLKLLGRLRRRAGRVRDVDVQLATLRSLKLPEEARRKAQLQRALSDQRAKRERKLSQAVDKDTLRKLRKRLRKLESALTFPEDFDPSKVALQEFNQLARQQGPLNEDRLHQFRIAAKQVRYVSEMAGKDPEAKRIVSELKKVQTALGDWHDWQTLTATAEETLGPGVNNALLAALRSATRQKFREAIQALNESRPRLLAPSISVTASLRPAVSRPPSSSPKTSRTAVSDTRAVA